MHCRHQFYSEVSHYVWNCPVYHLTTVGAKAFPIAGARIWNGLPRRMWSLRHHWLYLNNKAYFSVAAITSRSAIADKPRCSVCKLGKSVSAKCVHLTSLYPTAQRLHIFARIVRSMNVSTLSQIVFTQKNFVADFLQAKCDFTRKTAILRFWAAPPLGEGGLGATYDVHLRLIGKRIVDFLLVLIERISTEKNRLFRSNGGRLIQNFR